MTCVAFSSFSSLSFRNLLGSVRARVKEKKRDFIQHDVLLYRSHRVTFLCSLSNLNFSLGA